ncbi:MAG: hypothetical protein HKP61_12380 [Dactylosporangium sp.]|nr:hypothetical protein [Dactylosporangium sp.]NNJ61716.1 hypothetical protein [Dactylosporangium sp.]
MARIRAGAVLGVLVVFAPPAAVSLGPVGGQIASVSRGADTAELLKDGLPPEGSQSEEPDLDVSDGVETSGVLRSKITDVLDQQASALLQGNLAGFLASTDPADTALRSQLTRRFASLRAMRVAVFEEALTGTLRVEQGGHVAASVRLRYCFVATRCAPVETTVQTYWSATAGQPRLTTFKTSTPEQTGPRPWEVSELQAVVGKRVVVAGTKRWASRLKSILAAAERAAAVADRYAKWDSPPSRYIVYVAGSDEWSQWHGVRQASWVAAYAMPLNATHTEIVLNAQKVAVSDARDVLQHEFAHVVTLSGVQRTYPNSWWLVEGIAEYIQNVGASTYRYRAFGDGRRYARSGRWNGTIPLSEPDSTATTSEANGRYAVAFLAVRRLVERYGEWRMLAFFNAVAREGQGLEAASSAIFKVSWSKVSEDCTRYVRHALGG